MKKKKIIFENGIRSDWKIGILDFAVSRVDFYFLTDPRNKYEPLHYGENRS